MKILTSICLITLSQFCFGQKQKIEGIGFLKINKTSISVIDSIIKANGATLRREFSLYLYKTGSLSQKTKFVVEMVPDSTEKFPEDGNFWVNDFKGYFIDYLEISGVKIWNTILYFYKDILIFIKNDYPSSLVDAMTTKYGNGTTKKSQKIINCRTGLKITYTEKEVGFTTTWETGFPNVSAISIVGQYYDDNCKKQNYSQFSLGDSKKMKFIEDQHDKKMHLIEKKEEEAKKRKLKNF